MTLIKKISQLHKSASTANLLSMALIMSAVSCGSCGDNDNNTAEELEVGLTYTKIGTATTKTVKEQELEIALEVKKGELDPSKWTITTKDLKAFKQDGTEEPAIKPTCNQENKSLKDAGITEEKLTKDAKKIFKIKIVTAQGTGFTAIAEGKVTGEVLVKGKKMKDGKETDTTLPTVKIEFDIAK